jgi:hypothetical protein
MMPRPRTLVGVAFTTTVFFLIATTLPAASVAGSSVKIAVAGDVACAAADPNYNSGGGTSTDCHMSQTADLIGAMAPSRVFALGDLQYKTGSLANFKTVYQPTWGRYKSITNPVVGNHEYGTIGASGYFSYFGSAAGSASKGYYSRDITVGASRWHLVVINSECTKIDSGVGCAQGSPQYKWLSSNLTANDATKCTVVLTHRPRWSSSSFYTADIQPLVNLMSTHKVDLLLAGHAHSYERFAPQTATGAASSTGIREIVIGTGGKDSQNLGASKANSQVKKSGIFGVLKLTLTETGYSWTFMADPATPFSDSGTGTCH